MPVYPALHLCLLHRIKGGIVSGMESPLKEAEYFRCSTSVELPKVVVAEYSVSYRHIDNPIFARPFSIWRGHLFLNPIQFSIFGSF